MSDAPLKLGTVSMSNVSTAMPVLAAGDVLAHLHEWNVKPNKDNTGNNLVLVLKLDEDWKDINGKPVKAGFPVITYHPLQPSEKSPDWDFRQNIASFIKAAQRIEQDRDIPDLSDEVMDACLNRPLVLKLKLSKDQQNEDRHEVGRYYPMP